MKLTYRDILARQRNLITDSYTNNVSCNISHVYDTLKNNYSYQRAKMVLENWQALSNNEEDVLNKVLEVFTTVLANDSDSNIENAASLIEGKIIPKLRNAKQTRLLNNYKRGWIKHKHTSVENDTKDNMNAVEKAKANGGYLGNSLHPNWKYKRDIFGRKMTQKQPEKPQEEEQQQETEEVYFDRFINAASINEQCDRVLNNHAKLSKRFDLDSMVRKTSMDEASLQRCIYNICSLIESYDIPFGVMYNIALENISYLMAKNCVAVDNSFILEAVTDYFLMSEITDERLHDMAYILENAKFFSDEDIEPVSYLFVDEAALLEAIENADHISPVLLEGDMHDRFLKWKEKHVQTSKQKDEADKLKIKKIIHDFKKSHKKDINNFKDAINRIFIQRPEAIIQELPDIMQFFRLGVVLGATAINPALGIITLITGFFLKMKISREQMAKVVEHYSKERDRYKKLANETEDEKKKEKYDALYKQYKKDTETLEMKENDLYTDEENDKRMEEKWAKEAEANADDDFDFDFDFDFEESVQYIERFSALYEQLDFTKSELMATISNNIHSMSNEDIYSITEAVKLCNEVFDCPRYITILEDELARVKSNSTYSLNNVRRVDAIKTCMSDIEKIKYNSILENSAYDFNDDSFPPIDVMYEQLKCKHDLMTDTLEFVTRYKNSAINEGKEGLSFTSKLKIASENLRRTALKLKDKDKSLSMKLDSELSRVAKSAKKIMISDSREAIIRGTFLPSASKCIHIALASGAAYLIDPVLAIIGLIGFIGCSKVLNEKERNLILDDIDIEIKMCDKYLKIAEDKDDLTAVREIMKTKRDLERQRTRILYNKNYIIRNKKQYDMPDKGKLNKDED